jgi:hypothetical protein
MNWSLSALLGSEEPMFIDNAQRWAYCYDRAGLPRDVRGPYRLALSACPDAPPGSCTYSPEPEGLITLYLSFFARGTSRHP